MRVSISNAETYLEDKTLDRGLYAVEVVEAKSLTSKKGFEQLLLRMVVQDGPAQMNGQSPVGTEVSDFVSLDEAASDKPKGPEFIRKKIGNVFGSFGVDPTSVDEHDFIGKLALALIQPGEDLDGFSKDEVKRYKKLV